jgi:hypothetical protein
MLIKREDKMRKTVYILILLLVFCLVSEAVSTDLVQQEEEGLETRISTIITSQVRTTRDIPEGGLLLIPDSQNDRIMAFDPITGDIYDENFIPSDPTNLSTPIQAALHPDENSILISDQVKDGVLEYDLDGNFVGWFAPAGGVNNAILDNVRGWSLRSNGNILVSTAGGSNTDAFAEFDWEGNYLSNFIANGAGGLEGPWDILYRPDHNDYLVTASSSGGIHQYDINGAYLGDFATGFSFTEQITETESGNILFASSSTPSGVHEYASDGTFIGYYDVLGLLRGVYELPNGNILVTNSDGVYEIDRNNTIVSTKISGVNARSINFVEPVSPFPPPTNVSVDPETCLLTWEAPGGAAVFTDNFDSYTADDFLCTQTTDWVPWSNTPGGADDAYVVDVQSNSSSNSIEITGASDIIHPFGDLTTGAWGVSFMMYIEPTYGGYFSLLHEFTEWNAVRTEWALEAYFGSTGSGDLHAGGTNAATFTHPVGSWFEVETLIDLDADWAEFYVDGVFVHAWQWSQLSSGGAGLLQLGAIDIYATAPTGETPLFYIDDFAHTTIDATTRDLTGYNVYLDDMLTPLVTVGPDVYEYQYEGLNIGQEYIAGVSALYEDPTGESVIVEFPFSLIGSILPPENLTAEVVTFNDVLLNWDPPGGGGGVWIGWDDGTNANSIGLTAGGEFYVASRWDPAALAPYDGYELTKIEFFPASDVPTTYELMVWTGVNAGTLVLTQPVTTFVYNDFNEIDLDTPVIIDASDELWFGYATNHVAGEHPAGTDSGPAVAGYGDMITMNGGATWDPLSGFGLDYNWNLQGYVMGSDGEVIALTPPQRTRKVAPVRFNSNVQLSVAHNAIRRTDTAAIDDLRILLGFKVYMDGTEIIYIEFPGPCTCTVVGVSPGFHEFYVTAIYNEGESIPSNIESVDIVLPIPQNAQAVFNYPYFLVTWDPISDSRDLVCYNIYIDDELHAGGITSTMFIIDYGSIPPGMHILNVTAEYTGGWESEFSNDVEIWGGPNSSNDILPLQTELSGNYPNPFNPETTIKFSLKQAGDVRSSSP